jgi:hypothetical protein
MATIVRVSVSVQRHCRPLHQNAIPILPRDQQAQDHEGRDGDHDVALGTERAS